MLQRVLSCIAVLGLLASQLVAMSHGHVEMTGEQQRQHDAAPHFHFGCHADHAHGHSQHGHSHGHSHPHQTTHDSEADQNGMPINEPQDADHDQDAIFVSELIVTISSDAPRVTGAELACDIAVCDFVWSAEFPSCQCSSLCWHPPDKVLDASETFLILRNLRI